jgi:hypothetical protein
MIVDRGPRRAKALDFYRSVFDPSHVEHCSGIGAASGRRKSKEPPLLLPIMRKIPRACLSEKYFAGSVRISVSCVHSRADLCQSLDNYLSRRSPGGALLGYFIHSLPLLGIHYFEQIFLSAQIPRYGFVHQLFGSDLQFAERPTFALILNHDAFFVQRFCHLGNSRN